MEFSRKLWKMKWNRVEVGRKGNNKPLARHLMLLEMEYPSDQRSKAQFTARALFARGNSFGKMFPQNSNQKHTAEAFFNFTFRNSAQRRGISESCCVFFYATTFQTSNKKNSLCKFAASPGIIKSRETISEWNTIKQSRHGGESFFAASMESLAITELFTRGFIDRVNTRQGSPRAPTYLPNYQN